MIKFVHTLLLVTLVFAFTTCANEKKDKNADLPLTSHGKSATPNYSIVFPTDKINRIDITIDKKLWVQMNADLDTNLKSKRRRPERPPHIFAAGGQKPDHTQFDKHSQHKTQSENPGPVPPRPPRPESFEPTWSYCDISFNNQKWSNVGIRFKGNSSLRTTYLTGIKKLSFKLDFDQFEDQFPSIKNQRFYGFKQLNLKNNFNDPSLMREKVAADLFAEFGLTTAKTSFYQVFVDFGEGSVYFGVYSMVEEVDDTVIKTGNTAPKGNLYKPEGFAASLANGSFNKNSMHLKNNKKANDYSDVEKLYAVLNSKIRTTNYKLWKSQLNEILDVNIFLKYLAVNNVIQNWDTYGNTIHNYYLYHNPLSDKLEWIPWDNNEALQQGKMKCALSLSLDEVNNKWPLIRYILDDEDWRTAYKKHLANFSINYFNPDKMNKTYTQYKQLLKNYVIGKQGEKQHYTFLKNESDFTDAVEFLKQHVNNRKTAVQKFLKEDYSVSLN